MRAVRLLVTAVSLPLLPVAAARGVLDAPRAARDHPSSRELRRLLDVGFTIAAYRLERDPVRTHLSLRRGDDTREVASADLAFAAYAAQTVARVERRANDRHRTRSARPDLT